MEIVADLKTRLAQSSEVIMKKVEDAGMDISMVGKGPNRVIIFNNPLQVVESVKYTDEISQPSKINRYVLVSPQFGLGKLDFVTETQPVNDGGWQTVATVDQETEFKNLIKRYNSGNDDHVKSGIYPSVGSHNEFTIHVGGAGFGVDADLDSESFAKAKDTNIGEAQTVEPNVQKMADRLSTITQVTNLF